MSLSEKLNKNAIHIKKKKQQGGDVKLSPISQNYKKYLQGGSNDKKEKKGNSNNNSEKKINLVRKKDDPDIKIIHKKGENNKHKFTRKKPSKIKIKDINEIEKQIELSKKTSNTKIDLIEDIKKKEKKEKEKKEKEKKEKEKKENKKKKEMKITRNSKKHTKRKTNKSNKRISFKKSSISQKDIHRVENKIKEIRSKKTDEIKKELEDSGIKVSGKSKRLLKDIYLYSKICNINIQHEK